MLEWERKGRSLKSDHIFAVFLSQINFYAQFGASGIAVLPCRKRELHSHSHFWETLYIHCVHDIHRNNVSFIICITSSVLLSVCLSVCLSALLRSQFLFDYDDEILHGGWRSEKCDTLEAYVLSQKPCEIDGWFKRKPYITNPMVT